MFGTRRTVNLIAKCLLRIARVAQDILDVSFYQSKRRGNRRGAFGLRSTRSMMRSFGLYELDLDTTNGGQVRIDIPKEGSGVARQAEERECISMRTHSCAS